jgi:DNA (cytosine-5)-methyltransferase 1
VDFAKRETALMGFAKLFMRAKDCRRIIVSYNTTSAISPFEIVALAQRHYGKLISWEEIATIRPTTSDRGLKKTGEVILVFDRYEDSPTGRPLAFTGGPTIELPDQIRFSDLFCGGMGAMHLVGKRVGAKCVFSSDIWRPARKNYQANYGVLPAGDITKIETWDIPEHEILCGGFPCGPWSIAGHTMGFQDPRGMLFLQIIRIARARRPLALFLENVDHLASRKYKRALKAICDEIEGAGYDVHWKVLNSSFYGAATARRRIYFACFRKDLGVTRFEFPEPTCELTSLKDCLLGDDETTKYVVDASELETLQWGKVKPKACELGIGDRCPHGSGDNCPLRTVRLGVVNGGGQGERVFDGAFHAPTIVTGFYSDMHLIDGKIRRLAPREMANAMGFPRHFVLPKNDNSAQKMIGNSMAVPVVERIFARIVETLRSRAAVTVKKAA